MKMLQFAPLVGKITSCGSLVGEITPCGSLVGTMSQPKGYADYKGDYEVTPKVTEQSLKTKDKRMTDDVTIKGIEIHRVKNNGGGTTVYIAKGV